MLRLPTRLKLDKHTCVFSDFEASPIDELCMDEELALYANSPWHTALIARLTTRCHGLRPVEVVPEVVVSAVERLHGEDGIGEFEFSGAVRHLEICDLPIRSRY